MQPRFAAVVARPSGLGPDETDACRVRVVVNLPIAAKNISISFGREEIRRAVRPVEHADFPAAWVRGGFNSAARAVSFDSPRRCRTDVQHIARLERRARRGRQTCRA